jgi:hypothetical protein
MYFACVRSDGVRGFRRFGVSSESIAEAHDEPLRVGATKICPLLPHNVTGEPEAVVTRPGARFAPVSLRAYMNRYDHRRLRATAAAREEGSACDNHRAGGCATG